jgi:hypothetical protein
MKKVRLFTILDVLLLVAATAVGMAGIRCCLLMAEWAEFATPAEGWSAGTMLEAGSRAIWISQPLLVAWTLALSVSRVHRPRRPLRRLVLQPGTAVLIATILGMATGSLELLLRTLCDLLILGKNLWSWDPRLTQARWASEGYMHTFFIIN